MSSIRIITAKSSASELKPFFAIGGDIVDELEAELEDTTRQIKRIAEMTSPRLTGRLSGNHVINKLKRFVYEVSNITPYASFVHEGTRKMEPRPWLKNAHDDAVGGMLTRLKMRITRGNRKLTAEEASRELFGGDS